MNFENLEKTRNAMAFLVTLCTVLYVLEIFMFSLGDRKSVV